MTSPAQMQSSFDGALDKSQRVALEQHPVPAFGNTRCYWSLLDAELRYLYLDPACNVHMGEQAQALIGTCLLDYVHPDEQHSARADLRNVLDSRTLHGSVTRVRYSRLSRIRVLLGCDSPVIFPDAHIVAEDERYIACDVVINWVSDNVVLCFLHAIVDKGKADNDERNKTQWTNWCGTSAMTTDHAADLYSRLQSLPPPSHSPPDRIFQILINQPARPILFSWPPEGYTAGEFGKLAHRMQIGGGADNPSRSEDTAKTSCTRRYKATQHVVDGGVLKEVESIFIPHGAVIFACHKVMSTGSYADSQHGRGNVSDMYQHSYQARQQQQPAHYLPPNNQQPSTLVQGHYDDARRNGSDGDYAASGVPGSPEYARSRIPSSGYQRGPVEYGGSHYASQSGMRNVDYAQGGGYTQQYGSPYPMHPQPQRNESYATTQAHPTVSRDTRERADSWGYAQPHPQPPTQAPAQQWPASPQPSAPSPHGTATYDGQSWVVPQGWPQAPAGQAHSHHHQQQGYSYPMTQPFNSSQLPSQQQPQPPSPPPPYVQDVSTTQPPPQPEQPKRDASPLEEATPIPRIHAPPKRKREPEPKKEQSDNVQDPMRGDDGRARLSPSSKAVIARERGQSAGAAAGNRVGGGPPVGVMRCSSCQSETSPEWRKGPSGKKDLCNACGLRYARSKQKKDGFGLTKRRRDKEVPLAPAPTPPAALRHTASLPTPASSGSSSSHSGNAHSWPSVAPDSRDAKRAKNGALNTTVSHSPSPPRSEHLSQPEHNPEAYDGRYGPVGYPYAYQNGYGMEYGRMAGPVPSYVSQQVPSDGRAFAGQ